MKPILCMGDICADLILPFGAAKRQKRGESIEPGASDAAFGHGGSTANTAAGLLKLGIPVVFCGTCGADAYGRALKDELRRLGADVSFLREDLTCSTLLVAIVVEESGERTTFATQKTGASQHRIIREQIPQDTIERIGRLHCGGVALREEPAASVMLDWMRRCHERSIPVSLDISARIESRDDRFFLDNLFRALPYCTLLFGSATDEIPLLAGDASPSSVRKLTEGGRTVVVRDGARGATVFTETETFFCPAFSVPVFDTIGAGDTYNAGFLAALMRGEPLDRANRYANAAAAYCVMHAGGRACPSETELSEFLRER